MKIRPSKIILATGASEKFLEFPGNDLPGIYGAGAVQTLMNVAGVKPAERVLMVGAGNIGLIVSYQLMQAGVEVAGIIEAAPKIGGYLVHASKIRRAGVPIRTGYTIEKAYGTDALEGVVIVQVDSQFQPVPGTEETIPCDTLCLAVGLAPLTELCWQAGCDMAFIRELSGHIPLTDENLETSVPGVYAAGDVSGIEEASSAMVEGRLAGCAAAESLGYEPVRAAAEKEAARESYVRELAQLNGRREETLGQIKKKYNRQIREVADKQYLLEAQLQQIPARRKHLQAELTSWQRKEAEWKREQTEQVELQLAQKSQEQVRWEDEDKRLRAEKEKRLKQLAEELRKTEKAEEEVVRQETGVIHEEITRQRIEMETKKAELRRSQAKELEGSGADMSVITSYEKRMADIRQELEYIVRKRSLVSDFEKDKRGE